MMVQRLTADANANTGTLVIETTQNGGLAELMGLAEELALRPNMQTDGPITVTSDVPVIQE